MFPAPASVSPRPRDTVVPQLHVEADCYPLCSRCLGEELHSLANLCSVSFQGRATGLHWEAGVGLTSFGASGRVAWSTSSGRPEESNAPIVVGSGRSPPMCWLTAL